MNWVTNTDLPILFDFIVDSEAKEAVSRAADLKSGDPEFKSRSDLFEVVLCSTAPLHL